MSTIVRMCDYLCNIRKEALLHRVVVLHTTQKKAEGLPLLGVGFWEYGYACRVRKSMVLSVSVV